MKKGLILIMSLVMVLVLGACNMNRGAAPNDNRYNTAQDGMNANRYGTNNGVYPGNNNMYGANRYNPQLAQDIAASAERVNGVQDAQVVVYGNDVVIGIDTTANNNNNDNNNNNNVGMRNNNNNNQMNAVERRVQQMAQRMAPNYNIYVTSDEDLVQRVRDLDGNMRNGMNRNGGQMGTAARDVANDFASLVRDIGRTVTAPFR